MGVQNGSQFAREMQKTAKTRYRSQNMSPGGVLQAALAEPVCDASTDSHAESKWWDKACINACRVILGLETLEDFTSGTS